MYLVAKVFQAMRSLESDGTVVHNKALGARGTIYRRISPNKPGQVQVEFQGALRTMSARSDDDAATLETGSLIEVVDTIGEILIVKPLDRKTNPKNEEE
jgi:membrane protein implicated in regulation of membrane protease activity